jgi:hypothetical protein
MMMRMLKMAEPTMVPTPISEPALGFSRLMADDASSGAQKQGSQHKIQNTTESVHTLVLL